MKILIAGAGKVGLTLVRQLAAENHSITVIDHHSATLNACMDQYDVMAVSGNCASMEVLEQAGIADADLLIATTGADEVNLLCCTTAHSLNPRLHTIARIRNPEYSGQVYALQHVFGLSLAVNPERQTAVEIERLLKYPGFLKRDTFAKGRMEIVEVQVAEGSKLCDLPLSQLDSVVKCRVLVCAVLRDGHAVAPGGSLVLQENDRVFFTAPTNNLTTLLRNLGLITHKARRILLAGGGRISYYLAELLEKSGVSAQIIERDRDRCEELAALLPDTAIVCGDASDRGLLQSEGLGDCDALVSLTGLDELNMVLSLHGNCCGVPQVITKLGRTEAGDLINSLPLGSVVCPKDLCCRTIVRYVRAMQNQEGAARSIHPIADGQVEALEFTVDENTRNCGVPLKDLKLRHGVLVVGVSHGEKIEIAGGNTVLRRGDTVVLVSSDKRVIYQLNDIFE